MDAQNIAISSNPIVPNDFKFINNEDGVLREIHFRNDALLDFSKHGPLIALYGYKKAGRINLLPNMIVETFIRALLSSICNILARNLGQRPEDVSPCLISPLNPNTVDGIHVMRTIIDHDCVFQGDVIPSYDDLHNERFYTKCRGNIVFKIDKVIVIEVHIKHMYSYDLKNFRFITDLEHGPGDSKLDDDF